MFARLKPGVTLARAQTEMTDFAWELTREYPATNMNIGAKVVSLRDQLVGDLKSTLWAVTAGVGCVLLIACANLAGLLLTRGVGRERDFAVRAALGAGRARLIRQTLIESLLLCRCRRWRGHPDRPVNHALLALSRAGDAEAHGRNRKSIYGWPGSCS